MFHNSGKEAGKENRNREINNKTKKKIQQAIHTSKCGKLIEKAKQVHLTRMAIKVNIRARQSII